MFVELAGIRLYYEVSGEGYPVVLMHGWGGSVESFRPVSDFLSRSFMVYAFDFPGFGRTDPPPLVWGTEEYAELVHRFFLEVEIEKANIIAHSFGGRVAIWFAARSSEMVNRLILIDSAGIKPERTVKYHMKVTLAKSARKILLRPFFGWYGERILDALYRVLGSKDYRQRRGIMRSVLVRVVNEDLQNLLKEIMAPTLLIWGEKDQDVPLSHGKIMEKKIGDAGLVVFPGAGHFSYLDRFTDFCRIVDNFFGASGQRGRAG